MNPRVPLIILAVLLVLAMIPTMPYAYYGPMRWVVCGSCIALALWAKDRKSQGWTYLWFLAAGIYNPIVPVASSRPFWTVINLATLIAAGMFAARVTAMARTSEAEPK